MNGRGRRNDAGSSLADSVQRVRQNQVQYYGVGKIISRRIINRLRLVYLRILDFRQLWTPPRGKLSDLSARLLPEIFDRIAFERELKGNFAS